MSTGKILVADEAGHYLLKLVGDVRVTLCGSLSHHIEAIFAGQVSKVVIDMLETEGVDSTTLGLIAKLGLHCRKKYSINVQLFCQNPSILHTLACMGFDEIIDICEEIPDIEAEFHAIESVSSEVADIRRQVLEAHKLLIQLSPDSSGEFTDLIRALESDH